MHKISKLYTKSAKLNAVKVNRNISTTIEAGEYDTIKNRSSYKFVPRERLFNAGLDIYDEECEYHDTKIRIHSRFGQVFMNRNHKFNMFTEGFVRDLDKSLYGLETLGDDINLVRFGATDPKMYSRGTDVKTIHHYAKNKDMDPLVQYLNTLFNFHVGFAAFNKPLIATASGHIENSAISLVGGAGISCITPDAHLLFNETSSRNKLVPHCGGSYYLSRMPGEVGTFLALTGTPFTGSDSKALLGLADYILTPNNLTFDELCSRLILLDRPVAARDIFETDGIEDSVYKYKKELLNNPKIEKHVNDYQQRVLDANIVPDRIERMELQYQIDNEKLNIEYKDKLRQDLEHKILHDKSKLGSGATGHYINHYNHYASHIKSYLEFDDPDVTDSIVKRYEHEINRCFYEDSIDKIIEKLKLEKSRFGNYCIERLQNNDRTALNVTLGLLRRASKSSYSECLNLEMTAILNLVKNEHNVTDKTPMTPELIEEYFKKPDEYKHVKLDAPKHAALPTRHYYEKYADHMRLLMNEHNSFQTKIREGYEREVQSELREQGIDIRESGLTNQIIRTSLWNKEYAKLVDDHKKKIQGYFLNDDKLSERYYAEVAEHIESLSSEDSEWSADHKDYYSLINKMIYKCYQDALMKNVEMMLEKNKDIHKVKKKEFFMNLKKFLFESRLLESEPHRLMIEKLRINNLPKLQQLLLGDELPQTFEEFEEWYHEDIVGDHALIIQKAERRNKRRVERLGGYDHFKESEYWHEYLKYKDIREKHLKDYEERQTNRNLINQKLSVEKAKNHDHLVEQNEKKFLNDLLEEELELKPVKELADVENLDDLINYCVKEHPTLGFLGNNANVWEKSEPQLVTDFKEKYKSILSKFLQIGVLNSVENPKDGTLDFMRVEKSNKMDILDSFLSRKVNTETLHKMMDNVIPAVNVAMKNVIEDEAKKLLYLMKYQDNASKILLQVIGFRDNPEQVKAQIFVDMVKEEYKDDPEVMELLENRPSNIYFSKARDSPRAMAELEKRFATFADEEPINALQALCESICMAGFDISDGDKNLLTEIENDLTKHFGDMENPVEDSMKYGLTLLAAHHSLHQNNEKLNLQYMKN